MNVERLAQKIKLGEKYLIQDSMRKLISMMSENKKIQEEIIKFLPETEITKIMTYLEDSDSTFRKLTAKFLLELVYGNYAVQQIFCNILGILPWDGKVCINQIPEAFRGSSKYFPDCLEVLKKTFPEETRENPPYYWHFTIDSSDQSEKQIKFVSISEKKGAEDFQSFVDPLYSMVGFVVRAPKAKKPATAAPIRNPEHTEKYTSSKENDLKKILASAMNTTTTSTSNRPMISSVNHSLDQSLNFRLFNDSKRSNSQCYSGVSPTRNLSTAGVPSSSKINYPRKSKVSIDTLMPPSSVCNSERLPHKIATVIETNEDLPNESSDRKLNYGLGFKRYSVQYNKNKVGSHLTDINNKIFSIREPNLSVDTDENIHYSKVGISNNDSQDIGSKVLETSVLNPFSHKGGGTSIMIAPPGSGEKDISYYKFASGIEKILEVPKKGGNATVNSTAEKGEKPSTAKSSSKGSSSEVGDKKSGIKSYRDSNSISFSGATTPKNNLLSKVLKDKAIMKDGLPSNSKQVKGKLMQEQRKLNSTTNTSTTQVSSGVNNKHGVNKNVPTVNSGPGQKIKGISKNDSEYANKKQAFHSSLLKSIDMSDLSNALFFADDRAEVSKENLNQEYAESKQSKVNNAVAAQPKNKTYSISSVIKTQISTPRTPTETLKTTLGQNSKILNARKSQDASYLSNFSRDKRKSETFFPLQNIKNRNFEIKGFD